MGSFDVEMTAPPTDGTKINVRLEDGQHFTVWHDPNPGLFGVSVWRVNDTTWLTPWSVIAEWQPADFAN